MASQILGMDRAPTWSSHNVTVKPLSSAGPTEGGILGIHSVCSIGGKLSSMPWTAVPLVLDGSPLFDSYLWHVVSSYEHISANKFWKFGQTFIPQLKHSKFLPHGFRSGPHPGAAASIEAVFLNHLSELGIKLPQARVFSHASMSSHAISITPSSSSLLLLKLLFYLQTPRRQFWPTIQ